MKRSNMIMYWPNMRDANDNKYSVCEEKKGFEIHVYSGSRANCELLIKSCEV